MYVKLKIEQGDGKAPLDVEGYVEFQGPEVYRFAAVMLCAQLLGVGRLTPAESVKQGFLALQTFMEMPLPTGRHPYLATKKKESDNAVDDNQQA